MTSRHAATAPRAARLRTASQRFVDAALRPPRERQRPEWITAVILIGLLTVPIILGALLQAAGIPVFWPIYVVSVLAMAWFFWRLRDQPAVLVSAFLFWAATHKLLLALMAGSVSAQSASWLQNYKELMYPAIFAVGAGSAALRMRSARTRLRTALGWLTWPDLMAIGFAGLVILYFLISFAVASSEVASQLIYARRFASLPLIYLAGRLLPPSLEQLRRALRYVVGLALVVAAFGIVERVILGDWFWNRVLDLTRLRTSLVDEGFVSSRSHLINGMPANWFTFVDGATVRRLVSTFLEPTTLALFLAFAIAIALFAMPEWRSRRRVGWAAAICIMAIALVLTIGKGGYLALVIMGVVVLLRATRSNVPLIGVIALGLVALGIVVGQFLPVATNLDRHINGLVSGLLHAFTAPLGSGLGSTGFWGGQSDIGNDSTLGAVVSQLGMLGALLFIGWLATAAWRLLPPSAAVRQPLQRTVAGGLIALLVVGVFSNSATGLLAGAAYAIFAGWTMTVTAAPREGANPA